MLDDVRAILASVPFEVYGYLLSFGIYAVATRLTRRFLCTTTGPGVLTVCAHSGIVVVYTREGRCHIHEQRKQRGERKPSTCVPAIGRKRSSTALQHRWGEAGPISCWKPHAGRRKPCFWTGCISPCRAMRSSASQPCSTLPLKTIRSCGGCFSRKHPGTDSIRTDECP